MHHPVELPGQPEIEAPWRCTAISHITENTFMSPTRGLTPPKRELADTRPPTIQTLEPIGLGAYTVAYGQSMQTCEEG